MHPKYKKIYCCTPVAFHANDGFWIRDTGLISNTLRNMGIESNCLMPLPHYKDDQKEHLIRTKYKNLESVEWWKNMGPDAVVLYSWGAPKYNKIARAIHKAGIKLHIHLDTSGRFDGGDWEELLYIKKIFRKLEAKIIDFFRARHLKYADIITCNQPAAELICNRIFYRHWLQQKIVLFPTPVATHFRYNPSIKKERRVVCVGRWSDDESDKIKRPEFMLQTAKEIVMNDELAQVDIYGKIGTTTQKIYNSFPEDLKTRIHLKGFVKNSELPAIYNNAQVAICTSYSEGTHIASAEAICCGCSLVIPPRKSLHVLQWYTSHNSGCIATEDTPASMARSIINELNLWATQQRNPHEISNYWQPFFHIDKALHRIFEH